MVEASVEKGLGLSERSNAVVLVTLARYLADKDPGLSEYLRASLDHAKAANLSSDDLSALRLVIGAIGG